MHAFLGKWGLINFNVQPELKPQRRSLIKESTYSKVLINAANMHHLTKNEQEYLGNLFDVTVPDAPVPCRQALPNNSDQLAKIDPACLRRINLLTAKERPFCSFCNALVGFTWYVRMQKQSKEQHADKPDQEMEGSIEQTAGGKDVENAEAVEDQPAQSAAGADENVVEEEEKLQVVGQ